MQDDLDPEVIGDEDEFNDGDTPKKMDGEMDEESE